MEVRRRAQALQSPRSRFQSHFCPSVYRQVTSPLKNSTSQALWLPFMCQVLWASPFAFIISFNPQNNLSPVLQMREAQISNLPKVTQ